MFGNFLGKKDKPEEKIEEKKIDKAEKNEEKKVEKEEMGIVAGERTYLFTVLLEIH
jgi:hypothetical protein